MLIGGIGLSFLLALLYVVLANSFGIGSVLMEELVRMDALVNLPNLLHVTPKHVDKVSNIQ